MQIRTMKTVSKLMFSIGNEQSLKKILATEGGDLTISQVSLLQTLLQTHTVLLRKIADRKWIRI